jgi:hypothetical protein
LVRISNNLISCLFEFWFLDTYNFSQELIFKTRLGDNEVDNRALGSDFWAVVRILHLCLQVKFKVR